MQSFLSLSLFLLFLHWTKTFAQSPPPAAAPTPPGPANVIDVLTKAGHFSSFIHLIRDTNVDVQINSQLKSSTDGITIFAPSDSAFSSLKEGSITSLKQKQKVELVQFHVMTQFVLTSQFNTVSNPVMTLAGSSNRLSLNIIVNGNVVNLIAGRTNTTVTGSIYRDNQVAIYQINKVLIPLDIFAPAPAPVKPEAESPVISVPKDASGAVCSFSHDSVLVFGLGVVSAMFSL